MYEVHNKYCSAFVSYLCILDPINARKMEHIQMTTISLGQEAVPRTNLRTSPERCFIGGSPQL